MCLLAPTVTPGAAGAVGARAAGDLGSVRTSPIAGSGSRVSRRLRTPAIREPRSRVAFDALTGNGDPSFETERSAMAQPDSRLLELPGQMHAWRVATALDPLARIDPPEPGPEIPPPDPEPPDRGPFAPGPDLPDPEPAPAPVVPEPDREDPDPPQIRASAQRGSRQRGDHNAAAVHWPGAGPGGGGSSASEPYPALGGVNPSMSLAPHARVRRASPRRRSCAEPRRRGRGHRRAESARAPGGQRGSSDARLPLRRGRPLDWEGSRRDR